MLSGLRDTASVSPPCMSTRECLAAEAEVFLAGNEEE